jgi:hypothetical protein
MLRTRQKEVRGCVSPPDSSRVQMAEIETLIPPVTTADMGHY